MDNAKLAQELFKIAKMLAAAPKPKIQAGTVKQINNDLFKISTGSGNGNVYYDKIPLRDIFDVLKKHGIQAVQEDGEPWSGFIAGREGTANFDVAPLGSKEVFSNNALHLSWYKMDSGRYEIGVRIS